MGRFCDLAWRRYSHVVGCICSKSKFLFSWNQFGTSWPKYRPYGTNSSVLPSDIHIPIQCTSFFTLSHHIIIPLFAQRHSPHFSIPLLPPEESEPDQWRRLHHRGGSHRYRGRCLSSAGRDCGLMAGIVGRRVGEMPTGTAMYLLVSVTT